MVSGKTAQKGFCHLAAGGIARAKKNHPILLVHACSLFSNIKTNRLPVQLLFGLWEQMRSRVAMGVFWREAPKHPYQTCFSRQFPEILFLS
jgi:hypothetical protein